MTDKLTHSQPVTAQFTLPTRLRDPQLKLEAGQQQRKQMGIMKEPRAKELVLKVTRACIQKDRRTSEGHL